MRAHVGWSFVLFVGIAFLNGCASSELHDDSLWNRALSVVEDTRCLYPRTVEVRFDFVDGEGRTTCSQSSVLTFAPDRATARVAAQTPWQPQECPESRSYPEGGIAVEFVGNHPFVRPDQSRVDASATGEQRVIDGRPCVVYQARWWNRRTKQQFSGSACLDATTGAPLEVRYHPRVAAPYDEPTEFVLLYTDDAPLGWRPATGSGEVRERSGPGRRIRLTLTMRDHSSLADAE